MVPRTLAATITVGIFPPGLKICKGVELAHVLNLVTEVCVTLDFAKDSTETALSGLSGQLDQAHAFLLKMTPAATELTLITVLTLNLAV